MIHCFDHRFIVWLVAWWTCNELLCNTDWRLWMHHLSSLLLFLTPLLALPDTCFSLSFLGAVYFFLAVFTLVCACLCFTRFIKGSSSELPSEIPESRHMKRSYIIHRYKIQCITIIIITATVPRLFLDVLTCNSAFAFLFSFPDFFLAIRLTKGTSSSSSEVLSEDEKSFQKLALLDSTGKWLIISLGHPPKRATYLLVIGLYVLLSFFFLKPSAL